MRVFIGALTFALFTFCFAARAGPQTVRQKRNPDVKSITIGYLLNGNEFESEDATLNSAVGKWLQDVQMKAELRLKKDINVEIDFNIGSLNLTNEEFSKNLQTWISKGSCGSESLMHAGSVLYEIKEESMYWALQPHIICVLTKLKLYQDDLINLLGYVRHRTLCYTSVPMLLTYTPSSNVENTGNILSELVLNSTASGSSPVPKEYFDECNKNLFFRHQYVLPSRHRSVTQNGEENAPQTQGNSPYRRVIA
uniref:Putative lipocalin n=1 Tax=Ixodes ricinus TaxID=34613 RepID=A0A6B0V4I0_IXORI